jgi:deazaflavin-dependent oxidoreductase (nitroreductase family)
MSAAQMSKQCRVRGTEASITWTSLESVADKQVLHLTTVGRRTGLPREIEIWFVVWCERLYLFAETREAAGWVKNITRNPKVMVRIGEWRTDATARVLDRHTDRKLWDQVAAIANRKYGWGDGLPVEITPLPSGAPQPTPGSNLAAFAERSLVDAVGRSPRDCP